MVFILTHLQSFNNNHFLPFATGLFPQKSSPYYLNMWMKTEVTTNKSKFKYMKSFLKYCGFPLSLSPESPARMCNRENFLMVAPCLELLSMLRDIYWVFFLLTEWIKVPGWLEEKPEHFPEQITSTVLLIIMTHQTRYLNAAGNRNRHLHLPILPSDPIHH